MSVVWQRFFVLTILLLTDAKPISNGDRTANQQHIGFTPEMLLYLQLLQTDDAPVIRPVRTSSTRPGVLFLVQPPSDAVDVDPNTTLMVENFQINQWPDQSSGGSARLTRQMSPTDDTSDPPYLETGTSRGTFLWLVPRRTAPSDPPTPSAVLHPPPASQAASATPPVSKEKKNEDETSASKSAGNKVSGRSISQSPMVPNHPGGTDDESPDFLSTLVTIPQVWMHDLSHMIIQPLRKPTSGERDSFEYFGMVGKAPFIQCPLGFKKSSLGNITLLRVSY